MAKKVIDVTKSKKGNNKIVDWLGKNKVAICLFVGGLVIGGAAMFFCYPERITKLKNGEEVIVSVKNKKFTADELYNKLKTSNGLNTILTEIDAVILKDKYPKYKKEAEKYAKEQCDYYYNMYEQMYGMKKKDFLAQNGFTEESFKEYWIKDSYYNHYYEEYLASQVDEDDAEVEYKNNYFADKTVVVFLMESDKKGVLKDVKKDLEKGMSVDKVEKKYSSKKVTMVEQGKVAYTDKDNYGSDFYKNVKKLSKGQVSASFEDSSFGTCIVYIKDVDKKKSKEDAMKDVKLVLGRTMDAKDEQMYFKAVFALRDEYKISFKDKELKKAYKDFVAENTKTTTTTTTTTKKAPKK